MEWNEVQISDVQNPLNNICAGSYLVGVFFFISCRIQIFFAGFEFAEITCRVVNLRRDRWGVTGIAQSAI